MRWMAITAGAIFIFLPNAPASAQTSADQTAPPKMSSPPKQLPKPVAEPENSHAYASPAPAEQEGPSDADIGPVQKHFVMASQTDDLESTQIQDNATLAHEQEKVALDKHITIPVIHAVQNDSSYVQTHNEALDFEVKYLNWGAVTDEQLKARQGHYFTITWDNHGPKADFVTRFEYRQVKSKEIVRTLTQPALHVSGSSRSYFAVVNQAYLTYGPIYSWRFTVLRDNTIVAEAKSFIW